MNEAGEVRVIVPPVVNFFFFLCSLRLQPRCSRPWVLSPHFFVSVCDSATLALVVRSLNRRLLMSDSPRVHPCHRIAGAPEICFAPSARASAVFTPVSVRENILVSNKDFTLSRRWTSAANPSIPVTSPAA
ncbi:hypothetical protein MVEN_00873400 [Mycena venus]|uniref:Uncharacterized protein n=1 Tax=Mycena venus TaxID=2733690 RepID=A0A8H6YBY5_9AGAR|nr:hypothetical protein MVEN_00873400 [Mycena venus]